MENDNIKVPTADELNEGSNTSTADASTPNDCNAVDETVEGEKKASTKTPNNENDIANDNTPKEESQGESSTSTGGNNVTDADKEEFVLTIDSAAWFSVSQAQKTFGFTRDLLRSRYRNNNIPYQQVDGKYYFRESDLQALKAELDAKTPRQITPLEVQVTDTSTTKTLVPTANSAPTDAFNLDIVTAEIKAHLCVVYAANKSVIEIGKRLKLVKEKLPHGDWTKWLNDNFNFTQQTANRFMRVADRFDKMNIDVQFNTTQYIALLALPADETEKFIAEKAAAGTPVEEMTIKQLRDEIALYKSKLADAEKQLDEKDVMLSNAENELKNLREKPVDVKAVAMPKDYEETKKVNAALTRENTALKAKIDTLKSDRATQYTGAISLMQSLINFSKALADVDEDIFTAAVKHFGEMTSTVTDVARRIQALKGGE